MEVVGNALHGLTATDRAINCEIERVVESGLYFLIIGELPEIWIRTIKNLANVEPRSYFPKFFPETVVDVLDGIYSETVEVELLLIPLSPVQQLGFNERMILVEIWKARESAVLDLLLIIPITN